MMSHWQRILFIGRSGACAAILCAGVWTCCAQAPSHVAKAARPSGQRLAETRSTFTGACAGCHGLDGQGGERGPNIASREEVRRRSDAELLQILQNGISEAGMPNFAALGEAKLKALVSYLRSLQGKSAAMPIPGNTQRGESLFFGLARCSQCHMLNGRGGFIGPDLSVYAADSSPDEIRHSIVKPERDNRRSLGQAQVTLHDGKVWEGAVRNEDNFSLQLQSLDGAFHFIQKSEVAKLEPSAQPLMPDNFGQTLTPAELDDIVGFLMKTAKSAPEQAPKKPKREFD
jgi:putative heme-binding domain-containing protein